MIMNETLLISSLPPPFIKGTGFLVDEEKYNWQNLCIKSWLDTGHTIVSINEPDELSSLKEIYPNINFIAANRTTKTANNRPLVYISDAINFGKIQNYKRVALCNADVLITKNLSTPEITESSIDLFFSNRINIDSTESTTGEVFGGVDYFNMSLKFCRTLPETLFAFGLPWWDYWLPAFALNNNTWPNKLVTENSLPILLHKKHPDAWRTDDFCILGNHFFTLAFTSFTPNSSFGSLDKEYQKFSLSTPSPDICKLLAQQARSVSQFINENSPEYYLG